ncbi:hypothetical protein GRF59_06140 [Paenibacillus sp. HJL G12]|uniref:Uncharacterized protein n=1 Tax=Paenibacillus dendrobii TaxID=2691084 RepID=A0A7X3LF32_9BACL|nr:hypothetical protein [Paenibacillus dendrobii]MWV43206.1 hypothetical protein [Paenibacillus dendrobii]
MLEHYTFEKLMEYDAADRRNVEKLRREHEKQLICQLHKEKRMQGTWVGFTLRLFRRMHRRQRYRA